MRFFLPLLLGLGLQTVALAQEKDKAPFAYVPAEAVHILPQTTSEESGYFSLCEGRNHLIYIGTAKYNENAFLVEYDPSSGAQRIVLDTNKVCGLSARGYSAQSKLHTRNFVGASGKIYVGSKQGYRREGDTSPYPGGYVMTYDPKTSRCENLGMPYPGEGVIDVVADEARKLLYVVTCEDQHWMLFDQSSRRYRELGPKLARYASTLIDHQGKAYALTDDFRLACYDPASDKVEIREVALDRARWKPASETAIPTWRITADGKSAYLLLMDDARLIRIDLASEAKGPVPASRLGTMVEGEHPDSRCGLAIGPKGDVYAVVRVDNKTGFGGGYLHHLAHYNPADGKIRDLGVLKVANPDYYNPKDTQGKPKPQSHGFHRLPDGSLTPLHCHMALIVAEDGTIYITVIYPFTLLRINAPE